MADIVERLRFLASGQDDAHSVAIDEAANEITSLRTERDQLRQYLDAAQRRGEELRAQVAALEVDAGRYRWLRDKARSVDWTENINGWSWTQHCRIGGLSMDAAIDAALAARKGAA